MPRRGGARRTRARRTRARRTHITSHAARQRRTRNRHHRRNIIRSGGTTTVVTGSHNATGISLPRERINCLLMSLVLGLVLVTIGLTVTFLVSVSAGIAPISLGILSIAAAFIICITNFNKPINRTVEIAATPAPQNIAIAPPIFEVPTANIYSDQAPSYASTVERPENTGTQYGGFESSQTMNQIPPPPSYAEATR